MASGVSWELHLQGFVMAVMERGTSGGVAPIALILMPGPTISRGPRAEVKEGVRARGHMVRPLLEKRG